MQTMSYAAASATSALAPLGIERREPRAGDVVIDILYCGVCHSDLHQARNEWDGTTYPCVPGHEIVGRVSKVGPSVTRFAVGDVAAVGCMVDSCRTCEYCKRGLEQYCAAGPVWTYNSEIATAKGTEVTYGGYSERIVVDEAFVLRVARDANLAATAPLLCAGITTYSPLRHWQAGPGKSVGIVGLGGLGHMGVKIARAMGAHVVLFTSSPHKRDAGLRLGAHEVVISSDTAEMERRKRTLDLIVDTVSADHDIDALLETVKVDGTLVLVGLPEKPVAVQPSKLVLGRRRFAGSGIGGIAETQEMLDFCAAHGLVADVEIIPMRDINTAYERLQKGDVRYRFVIDMASLR
jgi:uncharacterized zinc-type alcohol dehydrogenase-like protein